MRVKPKILIATTERWYPTARLGMALAEVGCVVHAVCPSGHPLGKTRAPQQMHEYNGLMPLRSFAEAIANSHADFIVPGDDLATRHLHELHGRQRSHKNGAQVCRLIERSLGASESFLMTYTRADFIKAAGQLGVRVPKTAVLESVDDLKNWVARAGLPTVLKADGTSGGDGVRVVDTIDQAKHAFRKLQSPPFFARAAKRVLVNEDSTLIWPSLLRRKGVVSAQTFIAGREATSTVLCWEGRVLASSHFEVVNKVRATGHASVLRLVENQEMSAAVEKIVRSLCLSGFHGFDFMLEADTGNAYLLEINPRATQVGHLQLGVGRDLPAALYATLSGEPIRPSRKIMENETIALFPQEWLRDPESAYLTTAYHDVPWDEPELVKDCVRKQQHKVNSNLHSNWVPTALTVSQRYGGARLDCKTE